MMELRNIESDIQSLLSGRYDFKTCSQLATLYIIRDHMAGNDSDKIGGYSVAVQYPVGDMPFSKETAEAWVSGMVNEDGTRGPHWSFDQTNQVMAQHGISIDPAQFWVAMNAVYSDYCKVAKKYGMGGNIDFYVDLAKAFVGDKDARPDKLARYYEYIVKKSTVS